MKNPLFTCFVFCILFFNIISQATEISNITGNWEAERQGAYSHFGTGFYEYDHAYLKNDIDGMYSLQLAYGAYKEFAFHGQIKTYLNKYTFLEPEVAIVYPHNQYLYVCMARNLNQHPDENDSDGWIKFEKRFKTIDWDSPDMQHYCLKFSRGQEAPWLYESGSEFPVIEPLKITFGIKHGSLSKTFEVSGDSVRDFLRKMDATIVFDFELESVEDGSYCHDNIHCTKLYFSLLLVDGANPEEISSYVGGIGVVAIREGTTHFLHSSKTSTLKYGHQFEWEGEFEGKPIKVWIDLHQ